ncbi:hypothetical protein GCM10010298_53070 [Streptomyces microflavus]|uniref:Uncharacterized protein n=1 Tax=Streptomyces microflavus TaxID=1919 RepID=A0A7J0CW41_STRMI|nr:hypothetical protein Smic_53070 [Streptomyces microflavus]GGX81101.1 hypothetical protein GCM10010298_53070 [Streptomyces microflavus]
MEQKRWPPLADKLVQTNQVVKTSGSERVSRSVGRPCSREAPALPAGPSAEGPGPEILCREVTRRRPSATRTGDLAEGLRTVTETARRNDPERSCIRPDVRK